MPLPSLLKDHSVDQVDVLVIDVEGVDYMVFEQFNFDLYVPYVVCIEVKHMDKPHQSLIIKKLESLGYNCKIHHHKDLLAIKPLD